MAPVTAPVSSRAIELSIIAAETSVAACITIAARAPILLAHWGRPDAESHAETRRMVMEKVEAAIESAGAAQTAAMVFWARALFGGVRRPSDLVHGFADVATAAARPVRAKVRANARRLIRG